MSKTVEEQVNILFEAVKDLHTLEEIKPHCEAFNAWIGQNTSYSVDSLGTVLSRAGLYKKFRSILLEQGKNADLVNKYDAGGNFKGHELKHYALLLCGLNKEQWDERNTTTRVSDRIATGGQEVDPNSYLEVTGKLLASNNPHELAVGLIAATGRRPHEILARAKFASVEGQEYWVSFEGQGKKRGDKPVFNIATLYPANYVIEKLNQLRKEESTKALLKEVAVDFPGDVAAQNRSIDNRRGQSLRRVVREFFGDKYAENLALNLRNEEDQNNCKALRAAYLCLATERDCQGSLGSKMIHAARLAGHFVKDNPTDRDLRNLVTTLGYADYFTVKPVSFPIMQETPELDKKTHTVRVSTSVFEMIKNLQDRLDLPNQQSVVNYLIEENLKAINISNRIVELETENTKLKAEIQKFKEEAMKEQSPVSQAAPQTITLNSEDLENFLNQRINEILSNRLGGEVVPISQQHKEVKEDKEERDFSSFSNQELWGCKFKGAAKEKIRRSFLAICAYNDTLATGDNERIAVTNLALSQLSGTNRGVIGEWLADHKDEVISHNAKYGMGSKKDPTSLETYYNKGKDVGGILKVVSERFLDGVGG